jgi:hypothetical protein
MAKKKDTPEAELFGILFETAIILAKRMKEEVTPRAKDPVPGHVDHIDRQTFDWLLDRMVDLDDGFAQNRVKVALAIRQTKAQSSDTEAKAK